jgi:sensor histidine kinase regulating citrate/malate metabolism
MRLTRYLYCPKADIKYIDEIERGLQGYAADHKTGNAVLDTILTEKSLLCQKYDITMITIVDGALLNHIYVMDLCTIFGNALSNAIECEVQVSEKEKKLIRVQVTKKNQFISILIENHFEGTLKLKDGLPQTTKEDFENHGYGMKSIKYSVEKYGGHMQVLQQDEWFKLQIILPIK